MSRNKASEITGPKVSEPGPKLMEVTELEVAKIFADPDLNCRGEIVPHDVLELAESIQEKGLLQPISVQPWVAKDGYDYRCILGHRRLKAFEIKKWKTVPAIIKRGLTETQVRILNLQENLERKNLNILEEALAIKKFKELGYTLAEVAKMTNTSKTWVQVRYNLLDLEPEVQAAAAGGFLTQEHIKEIHSLNPADRFTAIREIKEARARGEKKPILKPKAKKNPSLRKQRERSEIFEMLDHIIDNIGPNIGTRTLAWSAGEISTLELYESLKEYAEFQGVDYTPPQEEMSVL